MIRSAIQLQKATKMAPKWGVPAPGAQLTAAEIKHWSKRCVKHLRHKMGANSNPPFSLTLTALLEHVNHSSAPVQGGLTRDMFWQVISNNSRMVSEVMPPDTDGWVEYRIRAV